MADHSDLGFTPAPAVNAHADLGFTPATQNVLDDPNNKLVGASDGIPVYKYQPGSFLHETVENPVRQVGAGVEGAAAAANHLTANVFDLLDKAADGISKATGLSKGGLFAHIKDWATQNEQTQLQKKQELSGGRSDFASQLYRGGTEGLLELPQYAVAGHVLGPAAGMAALGAINEEDQGWKEALTAAAQGALTGKALEVMGPASRKIRLTGAAAMAYAQARFNGADNATALANAVSMGGMNAMGPGGMGVKDIARMGVDVGIESLQDRVGRNLRSSLNPVEQRAVDFLREEDVPMRAGTQTGNRYLQQLEGTTAAKPLGAIPAAKLREQTEEGVHRVGQKLMDEAHPEPQTPESAGHSAHEALDSRIEQFGQEAQEGYGQAWVGRDKAQYTETVPLRTNADGTVTEGPVNMPVDITDLQELAKPIYDELDTKLSQSEKSQFAAFDALRKLIQLPNNVPAWQAEPINSALKGMARTDNKSGVRDYGQGVAASLIPMLQKRIDAAVAKTGPDAVAGLQAGRAAHANMMDVVGVREKLAAEPVQAFGQATWAHDSGIAFLRRLAFDAPDSIPKIARALVQKLFDRVTREGGLNKTQGTLNTWRDIGPETKKILFPDAGLRDKLDNLFKGMDMVIDRANPSGTEIMRQATSSSPWKWLVGYVGGKVLFTERGIDLLTQGLRTPPGSAKARLIQQELKDMGGQEQEPSVSNPAKDAFNRAKKAGKRFIEDEEGSQKIPRTPLEYAYRSTQRPTNELALNDAGVLYTTPDEAYSKNWGPHTQRLEISPQKTLDFTRFRADQVVGAAEMKSFLEKHGVRVSPALASRLAAAEEAGGEVLQHFGQFGKRELVEAIKRAGYDSAKINEYFEGGGRSTSTLLFDPASAKQSSAPGK